MNVTRKHFDNIAFLKMYRDLPVLWDRNHPDYKNRKARDEAEAKMLEVFLFDCVRELRNKIRSLRNTYNLELQRIHASIKAGADPDDAYTPKLVWFSLADSFLGKNVDESAEVWLDPNGRDFEDTGEASDMAVPIKHEASSRKRLKKRDKSASKRKFKRHDNHTSAIYQSSEELVGANEFVVFGQHVAIQLEKLPLEEALRVQEQIQTLMTRARLECLRGGNELPFADKQQDPISSEESSS